MPALLLILTFQGVIPSIHCQDFHVQQQAEGTQLWKSSWRLRLGKTAPSHHQRTQTTGNFDLIPEQERTLQQAQAVLPRGPHRLESPIVLGVLAELHWDL